MKWLRRWYLLNVCLVTILAGCHPSDSAVTPDVPVKVIENAKAFPGADGFGQAVTGGRGGKVIFVTTLDDSGAGSLRTAIQTPGARYILFKVAGNIDLKSPLTISSGDVTLAGQSAPGDGICVRNHPVIVNANNVIIRFMRFRMGDTGAEEADALDGRYFKNWIIDHCSMSWSTDECSSFYGNENFTMQWCILSESLRNSVHMKGIHGYGGIWGGKNASFHHNLLAHHDSRNPRFDHPDVYSSPAVAAQMRGTVDFRNNVIYNWGNDATYGGELGTFNMVANYYKPGPASANKRRFLNAYKQATNDKPVYGYGKFYIDGNYLDASPDITANNWLGVDAKQGTAADKDGLKLTSALAIESLLTNHSAIQAYEVVLTYAGASLKRDAVDKRIATETRNGTFSGVGSKGSINGLIDSQSDVGGWPALAGGTAPVDTDGDGMPDDWEKAMKLDPVKADANRKDLSTGYDNLEVYLSSLVKDIMEAEAK